MMRMQLQALLDEKEDQLKLAGKTGQRILAQQMELEDRISKIAEKGTTLKDDAEESEIRQRLLELSETMQNWEAENQQLSNELTSSSNAPDAPTTSLSSDTSPKSPSSHDQIVLGDLTSPESGAVMFDPLSSLAGPSAAQSSRRAKNAAHRVNDVEFAFDIRSSLLTEVRRLQTLLAERDQTILDMKEEKEGAEKTLNSQRTASREQKEPIDKFKEDNSSIDVTKQHVQQAVSRAETEIEHASLQLVPSQEIADSREKTISELKTRREDTVQLLKDSTTHFDRSNLDTALENANAKGRYPIDQSLASDPELHGPLSSLKPPNGDDSNPTKEVAGEKDTAFSTWNLLDSLTSANAVGSVPQSIDNHGSTNKQSEGTTNGPVQEETNGPTKQFDSLRSTDGDLEEVIAGYKESLWRKELEIQDLRAQLANAQQSINVAPNRIRRRGRKFWSGGFRSRMVYERSYTNESGGQVLSVVETREVNIIGLRPPNRCTSPRNFPEEIANDEHARDGCTGWQCIIA